MNYFKLFVRILFCLPLLVGCAKAPAVETSVELTGKWQLESVVEGNITINKPNVRQSAYDVSLTFKDKGELEATSANNYLTGFYETFEQNSIQLGGDGTERQETPWGDMFVNALPSVNSYDLKPKRLILYYDQNNKLIFSRVGVMNQNRTAKR